MSPLLLFSFVIGYFLILLVVAWYTGRNSDNHSFFIGNKNSNWMLVAFGMVGTSLSGVTFVSVPGAVAKESFAYLQITIGYLFGYLMIAYILLPLYYKLNLTSIYNYLSSRMGFNSYKTGSSFFILSRTLGATARLYLVVNILQEAILNSFNIPFWATTLIILVMILLYTFEGGVKTIVYTDTLQTTCMLAGLVICVFYILNQLNMGFGDSLQAMNDRGYSKIFFTDPNSKFFFLKQIIAGAFITVTMTGMDQEMMQKNISVKTLKDSQKNVMSMAITLATVIVIFLFLGGLLYLYAENLNIAVSGDKIFPVLAMEHMPPVVSVIFIIALISALFPSADGAITALTSTFCIDIIGIQRRPDLTEAAQKKIRQRVHLTFAAIFLVFVLIFKWVNDPSMIGLLLKIAAYTYGPLLGLFTFGIITKRVVKDALVPYVCIAAPIICFIIDKYQKSLLGSYEVGLELLIINGTITFLGLILISNKGNGTN
ncbi:MAG: sodium:solute symporter [Sphingobacteriia bacterium 24-36-13]|jgi:SSS family transporter|uniref:sodium:solute symporter n=1 Tax=Sediminibacterium sp. TaxID=1917865 RepID=UPI000BD954A3|nr:sodium:solute symporter [Sediminibacterium sp.]OYZ53617.1 MAG: sodium:solute symporter [Sphingobacteriia bacterium 24-36-13]OZA63124.1 MAG: sodium:solute symporter [Sphingobacteriia bacterium 39-36-14]HQS23851.1 sodium:solute symporter [Sediminibacterium sp.]HQS36171.1 sodium:solute symporter [Sediminibacterium sp.]